MKTWITTIVLALSTLTANAQVNLKSCPLNQGLESCITARVLKYAVVKSEIAKREAQVTGPVKVSQITQFGDANEILNSFLVQIPVESESYVSEKSLFFLVEVNELLNEETETLSDRIITSVQMAKVVPAQ